VLAVWDGKGFAFELTGKYSWWDTARLLYKYGLAPVKTQRLMKSVVGKFLRMYEEPVFPFESLTAAAQEVGLLAVTAATGDEYMRENGITGPFGREVVQASTRVNYAQNLEFIHGLEAMVCMATDGAVAVEGGNWKIFSEMVRASGATVLLHTDVREVKNENGSYTIGYTALETNDTREQSFDAVILASPYQFTNIPSLPHAHIPDEIPYVELHVTLFTSRHLLSPEFFGLKPGQATPQIILTTLPDGEPARPGKESVGRPGFFSLSLLRPVKNPRTNVDEYLYKIFSPEPVNSTFLNPLLGIPAPVSDGDPGEDDVSWIYRKVWYSYPYEVPRVTFEEVKLADNLWYTSGMDSFISTMETNALMGKNVARLVADEWMRKAKRYGSMVENGSGVGDELDV
jgi:prenylcysteine oxidase/farnesylcysteine lyase